MVGRSPSPTTRRTPTTRPGAAAREARIQRFREDTREQRMRIADEAEQRTGRKVAWGARCGDERAGVHDARGPGDDPPADARTPGARHARRRRRRPQPRPTRSRGACASCATTKASGSSSSATRSSPSTKPAPPARRRRPVAPPRRPSRHSPADPARARRRNSRVGAPVCPVVRAEVTSVEADRADGYRARSRYDSGREHPDGRPSSPLGSRCAGANGMATSRSVRGLRYSMSVADRADNGRKDGS